RRCARARPVAGSLTGLRKFWYVRPPFPNNRERAMEIFHRVGLSEVFRISHVIVAIMWMGLLWFFNFVQTPAYAEMEAGSRNDAFDKLTWRALWWFRWSAAATCVCGLPITRIAPKGTYNKDFLIHTSAGPTLAIGILFGLAMFLNV